MTWLLLVSGALGAEVWTCGQVREEDCTATLAEAVASAQDGDTIQLSEGRYTEVLALEGRTLTLVAADGTGTAVLSEPEAAEADTLVEVVGGTLVLEGLRFELDDLRALNLSAGARVEVVDLRFEVGAVHGDGGAIVASTGASLSVQGSAFEGGQVTGSGGQIWFGGATLDVASSTFSGARAGGHGGALAVVAVDGSTQVSLSDTDFSDLVATGNGGALAAWASEGSSLDVAVAHASFVSCSAQVGGAVAVDGATELTLGDLRFEENVASAGASAAQLSAEAVTVLRVRACDNRSEVDAAALVVVDSAALRITNSLLVGNRGGGLGLDAVAEAEVAHNHFLGNLSPGGSALRVLDEAATAGDLRDNLVLGNLGLLATEGPVGGRTTALARTNNLYWDNSPSESTPEGSASLADPRLGDWEADEDCTAASATGDVDAAWHGWGGGAHDAGSSADLDPDGSPADIGAFGGRDAPTVPAWEDPDGDGVPTLLDCAPHDSEISPTAEDEPYDGVDADCDGGSDHDVDGDMQDAEASGGLDCDDGDPTVYAGAEEVPYDGVDQNCDGSDLEDVDGDGYPVGQDCDDADGTVHPGALDQDLDRDLDCDGWRDPVRGLQPVGCAAFPRGRGLGGLLAGALLCLGLRRRQD